MGRIVDLNRALPLGLVAMLAIACGGAQPATPSPTPATASPAATPSPTTVATPSPGEGTTPSLAPSGPPATPSPVPATSEATPTFTPGPINTGPAAIDAPSTIPADTVVDITWTGPNNGGDYITIVAAAATDWTDEPYWYTTLGTPAHLTSPTMPGSYKIWYIDGPSQMPAATRPLEVTAFVGSLTFVPSVPGGYPLAVGWTGPNAPGDYVTIEPVGATSWAGESYFYTESENPGMLYAPLTPGNHEIWYVARDDTVMLRMPITVTAVEVSVVTPNSANHGATFSVTWTGPNALNDYLTIVPVGAPEGSYLSYAYTASGSPASLTAPDTAGQYEVRYVYGLNSATLTSAPIEVK